MTIKNQKHRPKRYCSSYHKRAALPALAYDIESWATFSDFPVPSQPAFGWERRNVTKATIGGLVTTQEMAYGPLQSLRSKLGGRQPEGWGKGHEQKLVAACHEHAISEEMLIGSLATLWGLGLRTDECGHYGPSISQLARFRSRCSSHHQAATLIKRLVRFYSSSGWGLGQSLVWGMSRRRLRLMLENPQVGVELFEIPRVSFSSLRAVCRLRSVFAVQTAIALLKEELSQNLRHAAPREGVAGLTRRVQRVLHGLDPAPDGVRPVFFWKKEGVRVPKNPLVKVLGRDLAPVLAPLGRVWFKALKALGPQVGRIPICNWPSPNWWRGSVSPPRG